MCRLTRELEFVVVIMDTCQVMKKLSSESGRCNASVHPVSELVALALPQDGKGQDSGQKLQLIPGSCKWSSEANVAIFSKTVYEADLWRMPLAWPYGHSIHLVQHTRCAGFECQGSEEALGKS